jgi:hypothetical protein
MDRNSYYGGESASLNLKQLWARFRPGEEEPTQYGRWQDWNFDMVPKFMVGRRRQGRGIRGRGGGGLKQCRPPGVLPPMFLSLLPLCVLCLAS